MSHWDLFKTTLLALGLSTVLTSIYLLIAVAALHWQG
jgi:hypothetical protein